MENSETLDDHSYSSELPLSTAIKNYLKESAKWAKFVSIVGFVFLGLFIIMALFMGTFLGTMGSNLGEAGLPISAGIISVFYIAIALIGVFPILYLYRFATKMQLALQNNDEAILTESFMNLKSLCKFYGIFTAIMIGIYGLFFVIAILGGVGAWMM